MGILESPRDDTLTTRYGRSDAHPLVRAARRRRRGRHTERGSVGVASVSSAVARPSVGLRRDGRVGRRRRRLAAPRARRRSCPRDPGSRRCAAGRLMRYLRTIGDAGVGAQTVREQPRLVLTPQEPGDEPAPELYAFRVARGLSYHPRNVVYSLYGRVPLEHPIFNTAGLEAVIVTTPAGAAVVRGHQSAARTVPLIAERLLDRGGLLRAHQRLFAENSVRYLACEGGQTVLHALHAAGLLDEVFLTVTDVVIDTSAHDGIL